MSYPFNLGPWSRKVTTASDPAQCWFDRGLNWVYAYNHEEAVICFQHALEHDPDCAMAWWGIAYASGPFYNRPWIRFSPPEIAHTLPICHQAAQMALSKSKAATPAERLLIDAIQLRYVRPDNPGLETLNTWHWDFTDAMRAAHQALPDDLDIAALYSEAAVTCTPRQLWNLKTGQPNPTARTVEALDTLERAMADIEAAGIVHPGIVHMYIHALEMSPFPQRAMKAADMLRGYAPDAGHLEHMPAHIYVLCGDYAQAVEQSRKAIAADDKYMAYAGTANFYTTARCHDLHLCMYAAMFLGQFGVALNAADRICAIATPELMATSGPFMAAILDGYAAMRTHVLVRFGQWQALAATPAPPATPHTPIQRAMALYGRGIALAALGRIEEARQEQAAYSEAVQNIPETAIFLSNPVRDMLAVGAAMLEGELAYHAGDSEAGFAALHSAILLDDGLNYTEPWAWMHPPRHALGALLAEQGRHAEAEAVFSADLGFDTGVARCSQHPDNVWALHGLVECVAKRGDARALAHLSQRLEFAQSRTDVRIRASCCCRSRTLSHAER